jgi:hypothetical protein
VKKELHVEAGSRAMKPGTASLPPLLRKAIERWENEGGRVAENNIERARSSLSPAFGPRKALRHISSVES